MRMAQQIHCFRPTRDLLLRQLLSDPIGLWKGEVPRQALRHITVSDGQNRHGSYG